MRLVQSLSPYTADFITAVNFSLNFQLLNSWINQKTLVPAVFSGGAAVQSASGQPHNLSFFPEMLPRTCRLANDLSLNPVTASLGTSSLP